MVSYLPALPIPPSSPFLFSFTVGLAIPNIHAPILAPPNYFSRFYSTKSYVKPPNPSNIQ